MYIHVHLGTVRKIGTQYVCKMYQVPKCTSSTLLLLPYFYFYMYVLLGTSTRILLLSALHTTKLCTTRNNLPTCTCGNSVDTNTTSLFFISILAAVPPTMLIHYDYLLLNLNLRRVPPSDPLFGGGGGGTKGIVGTRSGSGCGQLLGPSNQAGA